MHAFATLMNRIHYSSLFLFFTPLKQADVQSHQDAIATSVDRHGALTEVRRISLSQTTRVKYTVTIDCSPSPESGHSFPFHVQQLHQSILNDVAALLQKSRETQQQELGTSMGEVHVTIYHPLYHWTVFNVYLCVSSLYIYSSCFRLMHHSYQRD